MATTPRPPVGATRHGKLAVPSNKHLCQPTGAGQAATSRAPLIRIATELALIGSLFLAYNLGRVAAMHHVDRATSHAEQLHRFERWLHLPSEAGIQTTTASSERLLHIANIYYVSVHFPLTTIFLVWALVRWPQPEYEWLRNVLAIQTLVALAIHVSYPLAPPRMFPQWGFIDTMSTIGPTAYGGSEGAVANQFAAMPSLHVAWAITLAVVAFETRRRGIGLLAGVHGVLTVAVVVVTGNHWWLDVLAGAAVVGIALTAFPGPGQSRTRSLLVRLGSAYRPRAYRALLVSHTARAVDR